MPDARLPLRDAHGKFRKQTDEERWPNSQERERMQRIRGYFDVAWIDHETLRVAVDRLEDIKFVSGAMWPESVRRARA